MVSLEHDDDGTLAKIVKEQDSGAIQVAGGGGGRDFSRTGTEFIFPTGLLNLQA